jgi:hypothetical protein
MYSYFSSSINRIYTYKKCWKIVRRGGQGAVRWERENDAYYPRDKYRDIKEYFGTRYIHI